jgi:hypothetical protein
MSKRKRSFASAVKKRDKQCLVCGSKSGLCAHHIVPRVVGGLDIPENGATYCKDHHKLEHAPSGSAPLSMLMRIRRGTLPFAALFSTASWLADSGSIEAGYPITSGSCF